MKSEQILSHLNQEQKRIFSLFNQADKLFEACQALCEYWGFQVGGVDTPQTLDQLLEKLPDGNMASLHQKLYKSGQQAYWVGVINAHSLSEQAEAVFTNLEGLQSGKYGTGIGVLAIDLDFIPKKADLVALVRMFNRNFLQNPVVLVCRYLKKNEENKETYYFSIGTSLRKRREKQSQYGGEIVGKVSLIKDIDISNPHRGHLQILNDLRAVEDTDSLFPKKIGTFEALYQKWFEVFSLKVLNKRFYQEISNWFFWAVENSRFPIVENKTQEQCNQVAIIRLLTRLIFVWFVKEKGLVRNELFDTESLRKVLKNLAENPEKGIFDAENQNFYKAILQNLFFATLNRPEDDRGFAEDKGFIENRAKNYDLNSLYRYEKLFQNQDVEQIKKLFDGIPFLNGGLFDCLDNKKESQYYDGFTRNTKYQAQVPDFLFFRNLPKNAPDAETDPQVVGVLNKAYETKNKRYPFVKGIIRILESYKFTIEENTPLVQDVALDPELLGKIFESLLAYHNPETAATARKSTGSFYTPREIVEYMVEESLLLYLKKCVPLTSVGDSLQTPTEVGGTEQKLRSLLNPYETENPFSETETKAIVEAIYSIKIFDPACGSGAFPMGVLNKLVSVLNKLDQQNKFAKIVLKAFKEEDKAKAQIKAIEELAPKYSPKRKELQENREIVLKMTIEDLKKQNLDTINKRLAEIEAEFWAEVDALEQNLSPQKYELDYGKKLYLVQNCIYGVDIQNIAVQISKLRFFLSLVIDQKNEHIQPLPNLETKFIAANTLIGLAKPTQNYIEDTRLQPLEKELAELRSQYFTVRNRAEKKKLEAKDKKLREKIATILESSGFAKDTAKKIADLDIFDQNASADWFDLPMMFGLKEGFDIVIGNPPYVQIQKMQKEQKDWEKQGFETYTKMGDIYALFYEKGVNLLRKGGCLNFITSNKWMRAGYGEKLRRFFAEKTMPTQLIDFGGHQVFESATVDTNILMTQSPLPPFEKGGIEATTNSTSEKEGIMKTPPFQKGGRGDLQACRIDKDYTPETPLAEYFQKNKIQLRNLSGEAWNIADDATQAIKTKIEAAGKALKDWDIQIYMGIKTGLNEAFMIDKATKEELIKADPRSAEIIKPILRGKDIKRYSYEFAELYLLYIPWHFPLQEDETIKKCSEKAEKEFKKQFSAVYQHLLQYKNALLQRDKTEVNIKCEWYTLQRSRYEFLEDFEKEKIGWQRVTQEPTFAIVDQKTVLLDSMAFIVAGKYTNFLTAILNSKLIHFYTNQFVHQYGDAGYRLSNQYVEQFPIPEISLSEQAVFEGLVDKILVLKKNPQGFENLAGLEDLASLEAEIDARVFRLYGLSETEMLQVLLSLPSVSEGERRAIQKIYRQLEREQK